MTARAIPDDEIVVPADSEGDAAGIDSKTERPTDGQFPETALDHLGDRVLVTGASGFMGGRLCDRLAATDIEVRATDLSSAYEGEYSETTVEFVSADLTDEGALDGLLADVDTVLHTASLFSYASNAPWEQFERVNVGGTRHLCEAARHADIDAFVHWSTAGVYGAPESDQLPVTEDHPKNPESNYDRSKWLQEQVVTEYHDEYGLPAVALRPVPVYGPGNTYGAAQVWFAIANGHLQLFPAWCDYRMPLVHLTDVTRAAVHLAAHGEAGEAYNLVDDQQYRMKEVLEYVAVLTDSHIYGLPLGNRTYHAINALRPLIPFVERRYRAVGEQPPVERDALFYLKGNYWIDNTKLRATGFEPSYPHYRRGLAETIEWYDQEGLL
ncbi:MAG: NAD-dependent epimerase/dehydratase family protein [Halorientalis sp.]